MFWSFGHYKSRICQFLLYTFPRAKLDLNLGKGSKPHAILQRDAHRLCSLLFLFKRSFWKAHCVSSIKPLLSKEVTRRAGCTDLSWLHCMWLSNKQKSYGRNTKNHKEETPSMASVVSPKRFSEKYPATIQRLRLPKTPARLEEWRLRIWNSSRNWVGTNDRLWEIKLKRE